MIATTNMLLLASALASAGLFAAYDGVAPRKHESTATFSERFPRQDEMFKPVLRGGDDEETPQATINRARKGSKIAPERILALGEICGAPTVQWCAGQSG